MKNRAKSKALIISVSINFILIVGFLIYAKININNTNTLNTAYADLQHKSTQHIARITELEQLNDLSASRIGEYERIQSGLANRNRELEQTVGELTRIRDGIEDSQHRAIQYNYEAREIIKRLTERVQRDTIAD